MEWGREVVYSRSVWKLTFRYFTLQISDLSELNFSLSTDYFMTMSIILTNISIIFYHVYLNWICNSENKISLSSYEILPATVELCNLIPIECYCQTSCISNLAGKTSLVFSRQKYYYADEHGIRSEICP